MLKSFFIILTLTLTTLGCDTRTSDNKKNEYNVIPISNSLTGDQAAPDFTLYTLEGDEVKLSDFAGKIVILDFWATWCPPCRKGIPDLISIQSEFENDVVVIGISVDQPSTQDDLLPFIESYGINFPVVLGTLEVALAYGNIQAIPTSFIIDREGIIINKHVGLVPKSTLVREINSLLGES